MSQPVQAQLLGASHQNQRLFSDYYLDHILPGHWSSLEDEAGEVMARLQHIYNTFTPNASSESQTEDDCIKPVLRALGHTFEVQVPLKVPDGTQRPDYIFYRDNAALVANKNKTAQPATLQNAYAIGDAKSWERPLDQTLKSSSKNADPFTNKNPSWQIFFYMLHSGLPWGILTNGRQWRLYHAQSAHRLEVFYEVDLPALLKSDLKAFMYFYTFFRRAAFDPGPLSLDAILSDSTDYARGVSESLREQVYDALRYVAQGFLDYPQNRLTPSPETNKQIYDNSLILLYRLLFILYAEARDLLPLHDNAPYRSQYSLDAIKREVVKQPWILSTSGVIWARLKELFNIINLGSPPLTVTTFNGGLFDPQRHPFLEKHVVGDLSLCRAIEKLARVKLQFVDYRDLAERHLGTIYEGLLEYTLRVATEPLVELRSSSKIVAAQGAPKRDIAREFAPGEVYLVTDRGERKITGSYYTPDYIVKYMVDEAVKPALDEAVRHAQSDEERIQAALSINVLDPSMGSGHFPVEVTEYIARYLVELGVQPETADGTSKTSKTAASQEADLTYWKRRVAQQCIYGVDLNPLAVELAKLSLWLITAAKDRPLSFLDHHLRSGNALIGSWLQDIAADQHPGAKEAQKRAQQARVQQQQAGQLALTIFDDDFRHITRDALASIAAIELNPGVTLKDVKAQEAAYEALRQHFSEKYQRLANLGAALYYNVEVGENDWRPLADYALGKANEQGQTQPQQFENWLDAANALATRKQFLHWELEFPNIFFDSQGQPLGERAGFDVVIGNPPYVRQEQLSADKPFFQDRYDVYHGVADLFVYFFAQGLRLLRNGGRLAYISSNMWLRTNYATSLRHHLRTQTTIDSIVDLGNTRVFADAPDLSPSIQIVHKTVPTDSYTAKVAIFGRTDHIKSFREQLEGKLFPVSILDQHDEGWHLTSDASRALFNRLLAMGKPLGDVVERHMYRGILTGLNEAFIIDQTARDRLVKDDPTCSSIIKPLLRGEDLRPWYQENEGRWLVCFPNGWTIQNFPGLKRIDETQAWEKLAACHQGIATYLQPFADAARKRLDKGQFWWELRPCDYYDAFEKAKIFWPDIARFPRFSWDEQGQFINNKGYILPTTDKSLLGILQSRVSWFCISRLCAPLGERAGLMIYQHFTQFMERLPIPSLTDEQSECIGMLARQLTDTARERYEARRRTTH
ncbi:MAG TPA: Eco57I restriction-modification methylase domain-containing protein, partial [Ktedonobacteraceae bacterium]|nr:Eco57I restriction-modification methylase domain-containing protein [Ktedonobacteraceae bacterium]